MNLIRIRARNLLDHVLSTRTRLGHDLADSVPSVVVRRDRFTVEPGQLVRDLDRDGEPVSLSGIQAEILDDVVSRIRNTPGDVA